MMISSLSDFSGILHTTALGLASHVYVLCSYQDMLRHTLDGK